MPFFFLHLARRVVFIFVAIYLEDYPFLQVLCYLVQSLFMAGYLTSTRVFIDPGNSRMEIFNELVVLLVGFHMVILMSTHDMNAEKRDGIGYSLITLIVSLCLVNTLMFLIDSIKLCVRCCKRVKVQIIYKKQRT